VIPNGYRFSCLLRRLNLMTSTAKADPRSAPTQGAVATMTKTRWNDRFLYFANQPQQQEAAAMLYDAILALDGGVGILSETAPWAVRYSQPPRPAVENPLRVPFFAQNDNASGTGYRECFSSSCAMIAAYWKRVKSDDEYNKVRARFGDTTDAQAQLGALRSLGLEASFHQDGKTSDLKHEIDSGRPVAVGWLHKGPISSPSGGGHWSVIVGYGPDFWIMNDPNGEALLVTGGYSNIWEGRQRRYSFKNWNPRWLLEGEGDGWMITVRG